MTGHDLDLDEIKARATAATPGPWIWDGAIWQAWADGESVLCAVARAGLRVGEADAGFIAHARADVPALVAEVESLRAKLAAAEQGRDELVDHLSSATWYVDQLERNLAAAEQERDEWRERFGSQMSAGQEICDENARLRTALAAVMDMRATLAAAEQDEPKRCEHAVCSCAMGALPRCDDEPKREQS